MDLSKYWIGQIMEYKGKTVKVVGLDPTPRHPAANIYSWHVRLVEYDEKTGKNVGEGFFMDNKDV